MNNAGRTTYPFSAVAVVAFLLAMAGTAKGQHEYDVWYFGPSCSIDFATSPPTYRYPFLLRQDEGVATMCDRRTGRTLFYTDGITVWDSSHLKMENGDSLYGNETSVQSALVVPMPCDPQGYYIFTADQQGYSRTGPPPRGINYSIVDMDGNGGLGTITAKNIPLQAVASEKLIAASHANGSDYWVITHSVGGRSFYAWRVGPSGVASTPVISNAGYDQGPSTDDNARQALGHIKVSPDGKRLVMTSWSFRQVELFDFDAATGRVSNPIMLFEGDPLDTNKYRPYGASFSPDNSKVYHSMRGELVQYVVDAGNAAAIIASRRTIRSLDPSPFPVSGALQIGPDGRLYIIHDSLWVGYLENPNLVGDLVGYRAKWLQMPWEALFVHGLPNNIDNRASVQLPPERAITPAQRVTLCDGDPATLTGPPGYVEYLWSNGEKGRSITVTMGGTYVVWMNDPAGCLVRAAVVVEVHPRPRPTIDPAGPVDVCEGDPVQLRVVESYRSYRWSTGESGQWIVPQTSGLYRVTVVDSNGCEGSDSVVVTIHPKPTPAIAGGGVFCHGDTATLDAGAGYARYLWSTGDTTRLIRLDVSRSIAVTVWDSVGCFATSPSVDVRIKGPVTPVLQPNGRAEICEGDTLLVTAPSGYMRYFWSTGDTGMVLRATTNGAYSVTVEDADGCRGGSAVMTLVVHPRPAPPVIVRIGDTLRSTPAWRLQWSYNGSPLPGGTGESVEAISPGLYVVTAFDSNGCGTPSTPYRIVRPHRLWFDTVSTRVGIQRALTLRSTPPIERREMLTEYSITFRLPEKSIFVHGALDIDGAPIQILPGGSAGEYIARRQGATPLEGSAILRVEFEGLSTGVPLNVAPILTLLFPENDSVYAGGDGMILLQGCDVSRGFNWGKRILIRSVTPNPVGIEARIVYRSPPGSLPTLTLTDPTGRLVREWRLPEGTGGEGEVSLDLSACAQGFYRLRMRDGVEFDDLPLLIVR